MDIRFLLPPLSSREFSRCYLGLTRSIRLFLDFVGLTLLIRLVVSLSLDGIYSAMGVVFIRLTRQRIIRPPIYLLVRAYQPYLAPFVLTQFIDTSR